MVGRAVFWLVTKAKIHFLILGKKQAFVFHGFLITIPLPSIHASGRFGVREISSGAANRVKPLLTMHWARLKRNYFFVFRRCFGQITRRGLSILEVRVSHFRWLVIRSVTKDAA